MHDDCYLPWHTHQLSDLTMSARCNAEIVRNGMDRWDENLWIGKAGDTIRLDFDKDVEIHKIYMTFDSKLGRHGKNMPCRWKLGEPELKVPETLIKSYKVVGTDSQGNKFEISDDRCHVRFVTRDVDWKVCSVEFIPLETFGCEEFRVFRFEVE
jgi:hypothetical protein